MKKSTVYFFVAGGVALLTVLLLVWLIAGPSGPIIVSKQTTFLTTPLKPNGQVDYRQAIIDLQGKDVLPEENAAIPYLQATWPCDLGPEEQVLVCDRLKMPLPAADGMKSIYNEELLTEITTRLNQQAAAQPGYDPASPLHRQEATDLIGEAILTPWTRDQIPDLANWLDKQQPHFAKLQELQGRPKFFLPSPSLLDDNDDFLFAALLPTVQHQRDAARALSIRAMLAIGEDRPNDAWEDLKATFELSRCRNQPDFLISILVCCAIRGSALESLNLLLASDECDAALLTEIEQYLAQVEPFDEMTPSVNVMERLGGLDAAIGLSERSGQDVDAMVGSGNGSITTLAYAPYDRNAMLRKLNQWYDRIATTLEIDDLAEREQALNQFEDEIQVETQGAVSAGNIAGAIFNQTARGELIAQVLTGLMLPSTAQAVYAEERVNLTLQLTRVAVALEKYQQETGDYPDSLAALQSRLDPALLKDPYAAGRLRYEKRPPGFLLYSIGRNRLDDGGLSLDGKIVGGEWITAQPIEDYQKGDQIIRFPRPEKSVTDALPWNQPPENDGDATSSLEEEPAAAMADPADQEAPAEENDPSKAADAAVTPTPAAD